MSEQFNDWLAAYNFDLRVAEQGHVVAVGDGIVWVDGLPNAAIDEVLVFADGSQALVFHLAQQLVGAILLSQTAKLIAGMAAYHLTHTLSMPVSDDLLGRVVDPLGNVLDEQEPIKYTAWQELDILSPAIIERDFVSKPLYTGNKIIDNLIPIGKGQRQLIIGDNGLGKSSLALDIIINQKDQNVWCVYVAIGQKRSSVVNAITTLRAHGALAYTVVIVAEAAALAGLQYLAPFAGCSLAEYWMRKGRDTLVVYDDLTIHADTYRELSLLLRRPPGREAYPADIFYLHARLLERSTCLIASLGGGSMTALPIIETKEGDIATYIPTNIISITDGQIYFDAQLFAAGFLPAIDITKSVSRIGGRAQDDKIKAAAAKMKLDYLQFLELEVFTHFAAHLEPAMQQKIQRGRILRELLKQNRFALLTITQQLAWLLAFNEGFFAEIKLEQIAPTLQQLQDQVNNSNLTLASSHDDWLQAISAWVKS